MNWKIRLKNPVFWVQVLTGALALVQWGVILNIMLAVIAR